MKKILIIKPSGIGDIAHSLPVAIALKKLEPDSQVHWLIFSKFEQMLKNVDYIDKVIRWDREGGIKEYFRVVKLIRKEGYDLVIDLQALLRTALIVLFSKGKEKITVSLTREFSWLFEKPVKRFNPELHAVERNYQIIEYLASDENLLLPRDLLPWIKISNKTDDASRELLGEGNNFALFSVSSRGAHKIWPQKHYVSLIKLMNEKYNITPVFVGSKDEIDLTKKITAQINCSYRDFTGATELNLAMGIINRCKIAISNDNGIAHISAALNKPTLVIFGATNPKWYYPYNKKSKYIYKSYKCSPCGIRTVCKDYKCMKDISPEEVFDLVQKNFENYLNQYE